MAAAAHIVGEAVGNQTADLEPRCLSRHAIQAKARVKRKFIGQTKEWLMTNNLEVANKT